MSIIKQIPSYYTLMIGLIKSQYKQYQIVDVDILKTKRYEYIDVLIKSTDTSIYSAIYINYTSIFNYKTKKEFNPSSHVLKRSIIWAAAKDIEEKCK
ncbi:hypothetical protein [Pectinatus frisingensis]|uniref:hypothetical protein n=1 Tax=Pectinatus frisingensis TaxID=865 RepID=UPI0018C7723E|nr:hypothetical protein [Pectinatus frisingensis]